MRTGSKLRLKTPKAPNQTAMRRERPAGVVACMGYTVAEAGWVALLSLFQSLMPFKASMEEDYRGLRCEASLGRSVEGAADRADFVSLSRAVHREDEPPHVQILGPALC